MLSIIMIILGIVIGYLMFEYYIRLNIKYHGPNSSIVKKTIFVDKKNNKCYMFDPKPYICPFF
jgi:hypothetical protein